MSDSEVSGRRRSGRSSDAAARADALERLKALRRSGGRRSESGGGIGFQVKMEDPVYDTVAEEDYARIVAERREAARGFIVGDDGFGYNDEGEEEDWSNSALPPSSDEDDDDRSRKKKAAKKELPPPKKPPPTSLSAAAALMGKQKLSAMFTSSAFRRSDKSKGAPLSSESIVDDLIAECAPDEADREERRRRRAGPIATAVHGGRNFVVSPTTLPAKEENQSTPSTVQPPVNNKEMENGANHVENGDAGHAKDEFTIEERDETPRSESTELSSNGQIDPEESIVICVKKSESMVKSEEFTFNAKIKVDKNDLALSATAGWKAVREGDGENMNSRASPAEGADVDEKSEFELDADGLLNFYLIDAYEESFGANSGTIYLFGKVKALKAYHSCCVIVKNMQRCIYAIPKGSVFQDSALLNMEKELADSQISYVAFRAKLQEMASGLKNEVSNMLVEHNISSFSMTPVKRSYTFEQPDIPVGEQYVLKLAYPFKSNKIVTEEIRVTRQQYSSAVRRSKYDLCGWIGNMDSQLPPDLKGDEFHALLGTTYSALELFLVKRKIKGPSWLSISKFSCCPVHQRISWCKFEVTVESPKDVCIAASKALLAIPPVIVTAVNLKTIVNEKHSTNEIVSASLICCHKAKIDGPMVSSEWKRPGMLSHLTVVRKLEGGIFPMGFSKEAGDKNTKAGSNVLSLESSERALLNRLMIELHKLDSDILVGHNISGFDLDVLLHRAQACKVPSSMWSKIGRLKRSVMPKLTKGNTIFGSGASLGMMSCIAGRLLCDTFLCSRDLLREVSYSLTQLAKTQLKKERKEIAPQDIPSMFQTSASLVELVECGETDAWLSLELMFHLSILPLTRQLTNISGNVWGKTLQGARAQRVEFLLLHAFHAKKYVVPEKNNARSKELNTSKRKINVDIESEDVNRPSINDIALENDISNIGQGKGKKGPAYAGGLVLEPKKGLYDRYVLLLDFNSLYPSIIQEYNICFTTVERSPDGLVPNLPSSKTTGVLPELLKNLVERRKMVKSWLKNATGIKVQQLDIQQQALKLTANSMYGCLGFSNSRFYAKPLAELITLQGREILQSTVDLVQNNLNLEVIYGDTDSIMIYSGLDDIIKAKGIAGKVIQEVNKKYRCLEIDLDGLYKRMLLLKKKKYAAVKVLFKDGTPYEVIERKGLDMVRRDWSLLSKEIGDFCLNQILSGGSCDDVVELIHSSLMKVQEDMRNGEITLDKYVITKTLTKAPEEYPDKKNQPHVQVALRLKQNGFVTGCSVGDTVPYIICCQEGTSSASSPGIAERARHPDELKRDSGGWMIDIDYYLSQQIHPVVSRLCASIQGTSPARLADCLGLDSTKFQQKTTEILSKDPSGTLLSIMNDEDRYNGCEPLQLSCPSCSCSFECPPISRLFSDLNPIKLGDTQAETQTSGNFWRRMCCPRCPEDNDRSRMSSAVLANQVKRQVEKFQSLYYKSSLMCDDEMCKYTTRSLNLRILGDSERGTVCPNYPRCNGRLIRQYTEADLYRQLSYMCYILDSRRCYEKLDHNIRMQFDKDYAQVRQLTDQALSTVQKIRDRCGYGWVQLKDLCVSV